MTASPPPAPPERPPTAGRSPRVVVSALLLPLFFVMVFPLLFVSALHKPTPHELPLLVVGPAQVVGQVTTRLDSSTEFAATNTDVTAEARDRVADRTVDGAIEVAVVDAENDAAGDVKPRYAVTTYVATAEGRAVASTVQTIGSNIATELDAKATVVDVAALDKEDLLGTSLFYLLTYTTLGAYLVITVLMQVMPDARLRVRYLATGITAVVAPILVFGLSSIWVGDYDASFATIVALLGVAALSVFTAGSAAILVEQFLGKAATFGIMLFIVFLNFPGAGGASSEAMLPPFWQFVHSFYFGAGAFESFRSIVYFHGDGAGRWLLQLCLWTVGLVLATLVVHLAKTTRRLRTQVATLAAGRSDDARSGHVIQQGPPVEDPASTDQDGDEEQRSLTVGEGAAR